MSEEEYENPSATGKWLADHPYIVMSIFLGTMALIVYIGILIKI